MTAVEYSVPSSEGRICRAAGSEDGKELPEYGVATYAASSDDQLRVYGMDIILVRRSNSLVRLMCLALTDRVLVSFLFLWFTRR